MQSLYVTARGALIRGETILRGLAAALRSDGAASTGNGRAVTGGLLKRRAKWVVKGRTTSDTDRSFSFSSLSFQRPA